MVGYYLDFFKPRPLFPLKKFSGSAIVFWAYFFFFIGWIYTILIRSFEAQLSSLSQILISFDSCKTFGYALTIFAVLRRSASLGLLCLACVSLVLDLGLIIESTLLAPAFFLAGALCMVYVIETAKIPWKSMLLAMVILIPPYAHRTIHRADVVPGEGYVRGESRIRIGLERLRSDYLDWRWDYASAVAGEQLSTRLENATFLTNCINLHKAGKEFKHGETFWFLPLVLVPRIILPFKPKNDHGTALSEEYGLKDPQDYVTSINFPWMVEFYINFGGQGMVICSLCAGIFLRAVFNFTAMGRGDANLLVFTQMLKWLFNTESNITLIFGNLIQICFVWWIISRLAVRIERQPPAR